MMYNQTRNYTFANQSYHDSLCQSAFNNDEKNFDFACKNANTTEAREKEDQFEKSMEMVFEVGLLTMVGILGVIGNSAAICLFARYVATTR